MTQQEIDALAAENAALKAEAEKHKAEAEAGAALLAAAHEGAREALVSKYSNRIPPSARDAVLKFGATFGSDAAAFEGYLQALPVVTREDPIGDAGGGDPAAQARGGAMTAEQRKLCRLFGFTHWDQIARLGARGNAIMTDGSIINSHVGSYVPPDEFQAFKDGKFKPIATEDIGLQ